MINYSYKNKDELRPYYSKKEKISDGRGGGVNLYGENLEWWCKFIR